jgi:hypothetical protein
MPGAHTSGKVRGEYGMSVTKQSKTSSTTKPETSTRGRGKPCPEGTGESTPEESGKEELLPQPTELNELVEAVDALYDAAELRSYLFKTNISTFEMDRCDRVTDYVKKSCYWIARQIAGKLSPHDRADTINWAQQWVYIDAPVATMFSKEYFVARLILRQILPGAPDIEL